MRKRIYRISEDKFDDLKPNIELEREEVELSCYVGEKLSDSFKVKATDGDIIRGVCYCSSPYVTLYNPQFEGEEIEISFEVGDYFFKAGEQLKGEFTLVLFGYELVIPFIFTYTNKPISTSLGELTTLEQFTELSQSRMTEAYNLFYSDTFSKFVDTLPKKERLLYRGYKNSKVSPENVDEFLVACGQKVPMTFDLEERHDRYFGVKENIKGEIEITRSTWGFIDIEVSSDADFVSVEKDHITNDFFLGSIFTMNYYVHKEKMHAGKNFARISFGYRNCHKEIIVEATSVEEGVVLEHKSHEKNMLILSLCRDYENFRLRRMTVGAWSEATLIGLDNLLGYGVDENTILLYKALVYITNKQKQEALWIISDLKRLIEDKRSVNWAFLLYLCTLIEREESYVDRLTEDIEGIYKKHSDDVKIFWFLLFLRKDFIKNPTAKLRAIRERVEAKEDSPFLYIEAYYTFLQDPYLISTLDDFTIKILNWAIKHNAFKRDMAIQMVHVLEAEKTFNPKVLPILDACYDGYKDMQLLLAIVGYLLRSKESRGEFFKWYKLAVDSNLHVTGIFEAYMNTLPMESVEKLPQLVTMFFRYNNNLSYEKKALLYANIILHRDEDRDTYEEYERTIERFALEQLRLGRLDDNLAICYQRLLEIGIIDEESAKLISGIIFKKKVAILYKGIRRVVMYQEEFKAPVLAPVNNHVAYVPYIGSEGVIFLEDFKGNLLALSDGYMIEDIMNPLGYMEKLRQLSPNLFAFMLSDFNQKQEPTDFSISDVAAVEQLLGSPLLSEEYKISLYPKLIGFLRLQNREEILEHYFMKDANLNALSADVIADVLDVFVLRGKQKEAFYLMQHVNATKVKPATETRIVRFMINEIDNKPNDYLIICCADLINKGIIHKDMLNYLILNYVGPTATMLNIFKATNEQNIDLPIFAERILIQSLFRDFLPENIIDVFNSYMARKTNKMVVEAFLTYEAHEYLSKNAKVDESVFSYILNRYKKAMPVNESMRIALLKYLCESDKLDEEELGMLDMLLADAIIRNQYFGFYKDCDIKLQIKYHLYDKQFIEFKCEKRKNVVITYSLNGESPEEEEMVEMYDGLYVKQFVLFFGDELKYEIYCDELSDEALSSATYVNTDSNMNLTEGRYGLMNTMAKAKLYQDKMELIATMKKYQGLDEVTDELFKIM